MSQCQRHRFGVAVFLVLIFALYLSWARVLPFDTGPDERMRYLIALFIYHNGSLPSGVEPAIRDGIWGTSYGFEPIVSYLIGAGFMKVASLFSTEGPVLLLAARLASILFSTGTIAMCILISRKLFTGVYRWVFVLSVAVLPEFAFISAYVNNDALALFSTSVIVYAWIRARETQWSTPSCVLLGAGISICSLSYYNAYGFILCSMLLYLADRVATRRGLVRTRAPAQLPHDDPADPALSTDSTAVSVKGSVAAQLPDGAASPQAIRRFWRGSGRQVAVIVAVFVVLAGWWFVRNAILYDGDFLGLRTSDQYGKQYGVGEGKPGAGAAVNRGWSMREMLLNLKWLQHSFESFIAVFGYMNIFVPIGIYVGYALLWAIAAVGVLVLVVKRVRHVATTNGPKDILLGLVLFVTIPIPIVLSLYHSYWVDFQPQGRYLMPMLVPFMIFVTWGLEQLIELFPARLATLKRAIPVTVCGAQVLVCGYCLVGVLVPLYS